MVFRDLSGKYKLRVCPVMAWRRGFVFCHTKRKHLVWCIGGVLLPNKIQPNLFMIRWAVA